MIDVYATGLSIDIGRQGENLARNIYFDLSELINTYGEGTATLVHMRPLDKAPYVCAVTRSDTFLIWAPTSTDTAYAGAGKCELRWVVGDVLAKSIVYRTFVTESITGDSTVPSEYESWYEALLEHISEYEIASDQIAANTSDIAVLDGRMDEFTKLPDGSTAGDAELADIRVGADGTVYNTAGDAVRTQIADLKSDLDKVFSDNAKTALLNCFQHVAWIDDQGQTYYDALESALYADAYPRIRAVYTQGANVVYTDDALDTLKPYLTVKLYQTKEDMGTEISASDYSLFGTLTEGTSTITVAYGDLRTSVDITGVVDFYNIWEWSTEYSGAGKLTKTGPLNDTTKNNIRCGYEIILPIQNNRFGVGVTKGKQPAIDKNTVTPSALYPIPIPKTASKVTITITPSTDYLFGYVGRYVEGRQSDGYDYIMLNETASWTHQGSYTCEFTAEENLFLGYNGKKSDNSSYTDADRSARIVTVVFE